MSKGDEFYHNLQKILFPTFSVNQQDVFHSSSRQVEILFTETTLIISDTENSGNRGVFSNSQSIYTSPNFLTAGNIIKGNKAIFN